MKALRPSLILISLLCIVCVNPIHAQWELEHFPELKGFTAPDSLKNASFDKLNSLHNKYSPYWNSSKDAKALETADVVAISTIYKGMKTRDSIMVSWGYLFLGQNKKNIKHFENALAYSRDSDSLYPLYLVHSNMFGYYYNIGDYQNASKYALKVRENLSKTSQKSTYFFNSFYINCINADWGDKKAGLDGLIANLSEFKTLEKNGEFKETSAYLEYLNNSILYSIALGFYEIKDYYKSNQYLDTLFHTANKKNNAEYLEAVLGLKGAILFRQGQYADALKHTNTYLNNSTPNKPYGLSRSNVIKGLTLWELGLKEESMQAFHIADSLYQKTKNEYEELGEGYTKMIAYYKKHGHTAKQLEFTNKLLAFNEEITSNYLEIAPKIQRAYTVPKLLEEKEVLIAQLAKNNGTKVVIINGLIGISVLFLGLGLFVLRKNYAYRKRYDELITQLNNKRKNVQAAANSSQIELKELDASHIKQISEGLELFEKSKGYVNSAITLKLMAKNMETNSAYLSKYINAIKGVNYSLYVNTLRIEHVIKNLTEHRRWHSYTIEAIGGEAGFATARSFTTNFKRVTGISVSYFLKQLDKDGVALPIIPAVTDKSKLNEDAIPLNDRSA